MHIACVLPDSEYCLFSKEIFDSVEHWLGQKSRAQPWPLSLNQQNSTEHPRIFLKILQYFCSSELPSELIHSRKLASNSKALPCLAALPDVTGCLLTSGVGEDEVAVAPVLLQQDQVAQEGRVVAVSIMQVLQYY